MMVHLKADCYFEADDVRDGLIKLSEHCLAIADGESSGYAPIIKDGTFELKQEERPHFV